MKIQQPIATTFHVFALAGAISLFAAATSQAGFVPLGPGLVSDNPGVSLGANQSTGGGTVLKALDVNFTDNATDSFGNPLPFATGTLRSFVVDRGGGLLDFYYQLVNTTPGPAGVDLTKELYRIKSIGGFGPAETLSVGQTNTLAGLFAGGSSGFVPGSYTTVGLKSANSADRELGTPGSVGFDFPSTEPAFIGNAAENIDAGQTSSFLVIRSNSKTYGVTSVAIDGAATSFAVAFSSVPEPGSMVFGLALLGVTAAGRRQRTARDHQKDERLLPAR